MLRHSCGGLLRGRRRPVYWSDESIPDAGQRFYVDRAPGRIAQSLPQFDNCFIQATVEIDVDIGGPESRSKLLAGHDVTRAIEENQQQFKWLVLELYPGAIFSEFARTYVQFENPEGQAPLV
jgi:hypothetical protein